MYPDGSNNNNMDPRIKALTDALSRLSIPELDFHWAAVVDYDGLLLASYPPEAEVNLENAAAATAHMLSLGEKAQAEVDFGKWRYTLMAGSNLQQLLIHLNNEVVLTLGIGSKTSLSKAFTSVREVVPDLVRALDIASRKFSEPNTLLMRAEDLEKLVQQKK